MIFWTSEKIGRHVNLTWSHVRRTCRHFYLFLSLHILRSLTIALFGGAVPLTNLTVMVESHCFASNIWTYTSFCFRIHCCYHVEFSSSGFHLSEGDHYRLSWERAIFPVALFTQPVRWCYVSPRCSFHA